MEPIDPDYVEAFLKWMIEVRGSSAETMAGYSRCLHELAAQTAGDPISPSVIEAFVKRTRRGGIEPSPATRNRDLAAIRSYYKWACARGVHGSNPSLDCGRAAVTTGVPKAIPDEVWLTLSHSDLPWDDRAWLGLGYFAGLRRTEIAMMETRLFDVDHEQIVNFTRKGGSRYAVEYGELAGVVSDQLPWLAESARRWKASLHQLVGARTGDRWLCPMTTTDQGRWRSQWITYRLRSLLKAAGLPRDAFTPHALRHSCATNLLRSGAPIEIIADQLSHASIETTRRYLATGGFLAKWRQQNNRN